LRFLQDWLGHANIKHTVIYTALVSTSRRAEARHRLLKPHKYLIAKTPRFYYLNETV